MSQILVVNKIKRKMPNSFRYFPSLKSPTKIRDAAVKPQEYAGGIFLAKAGATATRSEFCVWSGAERINESGCI